MPILKLPPPGPARCPNEETYRMTQSNASAPAQLMSHQKGRQTEIRHKQECRIEKLAHIRSQVADGTLLIRQMTTGEREAMGRQSGR